MMLNTNMISRIKLILELVFILVFIYLTLPFYNNSILVLRVWASSILIFLAFIIRQVQLNKNNLKNLLNPTIIFFIIFSISQTINNIIILRGVYGLTYEIIYYILILFILIYNFSNPRYIETGLVLFIIYSFRIFDSALIVNEFTMVHALSIILALLWLDDAYAKRYTLPEVNSIFGSLVFLVIIAIFSMVNAACPYNSLVQVMIMVNFIFVAFIIANYVRDIKQANIIIFSLFFIGLVLSILIGIEVLKAGIHSAERRIWIDINSPFRIHPNSIAGYFSVLLCLVIGSLHLYKKAIFRICAMLFIFIMLIILLLTYSRLGIFSFIFAATILLILRYRETMEFIRNRILYVSLGSIFITLVIFLTPIRQNMIERMHNVYSSKQTFYSCWNSLKAVRDKPMFGFGLDNYYILSRYAKDQIFMPSGAGILSTRNVIAGPTHSTYLGIAFGLGIIGLLVFMWLLISVIAYFIKLNKHIPPFRHERELLHGIFAAFISLLIHGILAMTFHLTILPAFFWVFIGLIISIGNIVNFNKMGAFKFKPQNFFIALSIILFFTVCAVICPVIAEKRYTSALKKLESRDLDMAMNMINQAKIFMPINPKFYELSAEIKTNQGLIDEAIEYYKQALALKRDFAFYHTRLGQLYRQKKMYPYALRELEKAVSLDKYGVCYQEHYSDLGGLYKKMGDREESITQFKKALLIEPEVARDGNWSGLDYLDEILNKMQQDYLILKDTNPLEAEQVLFALNKSSKYKKKR